MSNETKLKALEEALKTINKKSKSEQGTLINLMSNKPEANVKLISSGSLVLDAILGGGIPAGRVIEIYGPEASGKTSIALTAVANVQRDGGTAAFIDLEQALDPRYARKLGVDVDNLALSQPEYGEQALDLVEALAASGAVDIIVVDSVAALVPKAELEGDMETQTMAVVARMMSKCLRRLVATANQTKTTVVFINQTRMKVGFVMGNPETTTGGKALQFFASQRIDVRKKDKVVDGKTVLGNQVKLKVVKNKIAPPYGEGTTILTFNEGINRAAELLDDAVGVAYGIIARPNSRTFVEVETGETIGTSRAAAIEKIKSDKELFDRLTVAFKAAVDRVGIGEGAESPFQDDVLEEDGLEED